MAPVGCTVEPGIETHMSPRPLGAAFVRLLTAHGAAHLGTGTYLAALPLLATSLSSDPRIIAGLAVAGTVPTFVLALPLGVWADRGNRPRLMIGSNLVCGLTLLGVALLTGLGRVHLWVLAAAATLLEAAHLLASTASFALVPSLVPRSELTRANGYLEITSETTAGVIGPPAAGLAFVAGPLLAPVLAAASYLAACALLRPLARRPEQADPSAAPGPAPSVQAGRREGEPAPGPWSEMVAGVRYVSMHQALRSTVVLGAAFSLFGWMPEATLVLFATDDLGLSPAGFGVLLAVTTVGAVVGGVTLQPLSARISTARLVVGTHLLYGLLLIPVGLTDNAWVVGVIFFLQGIPLIISNAALQSLQQALTPDHLLGRVGSVIRLAGGISAPLGLAAGGLLAHTLDLATVWVLAGITCTLITLALAAPTLSAPDDSRGEADGP